MPDFRPRGADPNVRNRDITTEVCAEAFLLRQKPGNIALGVVLGGLQSREPQWYGPF